MSAKSGKGDKGRARRKVKADRKPQGIQSFLAEINRLTRDLDFAVRMYAVELRAQNFTEDQIEQRQLQALKEALQRLK